MIITVSTGEYEQNYLFESIDVNFTMAFRKKVLSINDYHINSRISDFHIYNKVQSLKTALNGMHATAYHAILGRSKAILNKRA